MSTTARRPRWLECRGGERQSKAERLLPVAIRPSLYIGEGKSDCKNDHEKA